MAHLTLMVMGSREGDQELLIFADPDGSMLELVLGSLPAPARDPWTFKAIMARMIGAERGETLAPEDCAALARLVEATSSYRLEWALRAAGEVRRPHNRWTSRSSAAPQFTLTARALQYWSERMGELTAHLRLAAGRDGLRVIVEPVRSW